MMVLGRNGWGKKNGWELLFYYNSNQTKTQLLTITSKHKKNSCVKANGEEE